MPTAERLPLLPTFIEHMTGLVVLMEEDDAGDVVERVDHIGDDHFAHASGYVLMALEYLEASGSEFDFFM
jgi:hypothetical protein